MSIVSLEINDYNTSIHDIVQTHVMLSYHENTNENEKLKNVYFQTHRSFT